MTIKTNRLETEKIALLSRKLQSCNDIVAAFLHGSAAKGQLHPGSDVDIALLMPPRKKLSTSKLLGLAGILESGLGRAVHLGQLSLDNLIYATEVYQHGEELFCRDRDLCDQFFMNLLSRYADFNVARQGVLDAYLVSEGKNEYSAE